MVAARVFTPPFRIIRWYSLVFLVLIFFVVFSSDSLAGCQAYPYYSNGCSYGNSSGCRTSGTIATEWSNCTGGSQEVLVWFCDTQPEARAICGDGPPPPPPSGCGRCEGCSDLRNCRDLGNWDGPGGQCERAGCVEDFGQCGGGTYCPSWGSCSGKGQGDCQRTNGCSWRDLTNTCSTGCYLPSGQSCGSQVCRNSCGNEISDSCGSVPCNQPPSLQNVTISSSSVRPDNVSQYTIGVQAFDSQGASDIYALYALINYQGTNAGAYRGYLTWTTGNSFPSAKDNRACSGGGHGAIQSGYGSGYLRLDSCSTSTSGSSRTASFTVRFDPTFTSPQSNNSISGYTADSRSQIDGWELFNANFSLAIEGTLRVTTTPNTINPTFVVNNSGGAQKGSGTGPGPVSLSLLPETYSVIFNDFPNYTKPANRSASITPYTTVDVTGDYVISGGSLTGLVFADTDENGLKGGSESGSNQAQVWVVNSSGSVQGPVTPDGSGSFTFDNLSAGSYRLEVTTTWPYRVTSWSAPSDPAGSSYGGPLANSRYFTQKLGNDYPLSVALGSSAQANLGAKQGQTTNLTVNVYDDVNGNGYLDQGEPLVASPTRITCTPTSGTGDPCQPLVTLNTGTTTLSLIQTLTYSLNYDAAGSSPYTYVTAVWLNGSPTIRPVSLNVDATADRLDFLVTDSALPWIQVWDGDVYSHYNGNLSTPAININLNPAPSAPHRPYFIQSSLSPGAGGLSLTRTGSLGATCSGSSSACSERGWVIKDYSDPGFPWPAALDQITESGVNLVYYSTAYTLNAGEKDKYLTGGENFRKIILVSGDLTFETQGVASGRNQALNAFFVSRGKIIITGPSTANQLVIKGGLYAKESLTFDYALNDNSLPAVLIEYDPMLLLGY